MKKILFLLLFLLTPISCYALEYPSVNSKVVEVYDLNDEKILYEVNSNDVVSIASLTKLATIMTGIENIENLDEEVTITYSILNTVDPSASVAGLRSGDVVTYRDLLYAAMLPSGADATNSIAILTSGNIENYVNKMNEFVKKIGLKNTHFVNVTGLDDDNHYSTADDVRKLLEYSLKNKTFRELYTAKEYTMKNGKLLKSTLYKYNTPSDGLEKIIGSKSGSTGNAGYCLSSLSNINGHEVITIVLNASRSGNTFYNISDTLTLINFMNNNYKEETLLKKNSVVKVLPVKLSNISKYKTKSKKDIKKYLPSDYDIKKFKIKYKGIKELNFTNKKDNKIGTVSYYYDKELLLKEEVILNKNINIDLIKVFKTYYYIIIPTLLIFVLLILVIRKRKHKKNK